MNKLALSVDTRNRGMPVAQVSTYRNYYADANIDRVKLPKDARFMEITVIGANPAWVRFGDENVEVNPPAATVADGTAPLIILGWSVLLFELPTNVSHFAVDSSNPVAISFWS